MLGTKYEVPENPADRPRRERRAVRVLVVDFAGRILLFHDSDPGLDDATWWMTPGGGIEPGETERAAAAREIAEETGLQLSQAELLGPIATRLVRHGYSDHVTDQHETFFFARVPAFEVDVAGHTEVERRTLIGSRWWLPGDLLTTTERIWPPNLLAVLALRKSPESWPVDLGESEEATLATDATSYPNSAAES